MLILATTAEPTETTTPPLDCNSLVKDALDIAEWPEYCNNPAILENYGGCCLEIFDGNDEACKPPPTQGPPPSSPPIYQIDWCPRRIKQTSDLQEYPVCCLHPAVSRQQEFKNACCETFGLCTEERTTRGFQITGRVCDLNSCPRKFRTPNW